MPSIRDTVSAYLSAVYGSDTATARRCLADQFSFIGPATRLSDPDRYLSTTEHAARAVRRVEVHTIIVDGQDACSFYDLHVDHAVKVVPVAEWYHFEGNRISAIRTILDTAPFSAGAETAVDLVCGMTVEKASASATPPPTTGWLNSSAATPVPRPLTYIQNGSSRALDRPAARPLPPPTLMPRRQRSSFDRRRRGADTNCGKSPAKRSLRCWLH
jgi:hypothetical protein